MRLTILKRFESIYSGRGRKLYRNIVKILSPYRRNLEG